MSAGPAGAGTTAPSSNNLSLLARLTGVVTRPRSTFAAVVEYPRWAGLLAVLTAASFAALAVQPLLGRVYTEDEAQGDGRAGVIVLSHRLWQRRFGGRPDIIGQEVRLASSSN